MVCIDLHGVKDPHGIIEQAEFGVQGDQGVTDLGDGIPSTLHYELFS